MAIGAKASKLLPVAASFHVVKIEDAYIGMSAVFTAVPLATSRAKRSRSVATSQTAISAGVEPADHHALSRLKERLGLLESISRKIDRAIGKV